MATDDARRWDERYASREVSAAEPPDALSEAGLVGSLPHGGRALDVACGAGAQSVWLAQRGFEVTAVDVSAAAIELTRAAGELGAVADLIDAHVVDLDDWAREGIPGRFDVIVCQRFRAVGLYDSFVSALHPGGIAVVTVLSQVGADNPGPFHAPPGELREAFARPDVTVLHHHEADGTASIIFTSRH